MQDEHWLALRREGLGGSDIAAVVGLDPYRTPWQVYWDKVGRERPRRETPAMRLGTLLEPLLAQLYCEHEGADTLDQPGLLIHRQESWRRGTPDGLWTAKRRGVDFKTAGLFMAKQWGPPGSADVPVSYAMQCAWYMSLTGYERWDLALLLGGQDFRVYHLARDRELEELLLAEGRRFWQEHVAARVPPALDGSADALTYLTQRFPRVTQPLRVATPEEAALVTAYREAWEEEQAWKQEKKRLEMGLKAAIAEARGVTVDGLQATWLEVSGHPVVDWQALALELGATPELIAAHTVRLPESRRFQVRSLRDGRSNPGS